ncbi:NTP transferase domain-containing protein [Helicobacter pylori]|uniref:NTP transferase domain-containing protein n=1 Tax=Helicobacter pylori TaxID=210 RepID=UPI0010363DD0|nr:NTP transferase domain-containing protein [Helicobacter pylori]
MKNPIIDNIPCVLLAGGKSSRFITNNIQINKALMPFESHVSLLEYQYMRLLKLFKKVIISAKKSYELNAPYLLVSYALKTQNYRLSDLVKNTSSIAMHFNKEEEFLNLNTLKDYELAVQILKERANG